MNRKEQGVAMLSLGTVLCVVALAVLTALGFDSLFPWTLGNTVDRIEADHHIVLMWGLGYMTFVLGGIAGFLFNEGIRRLRD